MSALKLRAVLLNIKLPALSAFFAFTKAKSPTIASYNKYFFPLKMPVGLGLLCSYISLDPCLNLIGKPPS